MKLTKNYILSFEGIEGSGKSTQIQKFTEYLKSQNIEYHLFREPGTTVVGEEIRKLLLSKDYEIDPKTELMLFLSSRTALLNEKVTPLIKSNTPSVIIFDRYKDSTYAYQGAGRGISKEHIKTLHSIPPLNLETDLTIYLDISIETSEQRVQKRGEGKDKIEEEHKSFFEKVRNEYLSISKERKSFVCIDGSQDLKDVSNDVIKAFESIL